MNIDDLVKSFPQGLFIAGIVSSIRQNYMQRPDGSDVIDGKHVLAVVAALSLALCIVLDPTHDLRNGIIHGVIVTLYAAGGVSLIDRNAKKSGEATAAAHAKAKTRAAAAPKPTAPKDGGHDGQ